jgi:hypothetical protein
MFDQIFFRYYSRKRKAKCIAEDGSLLAERVRNGRKVYLYMVQNFFLEALYSQDDLYGELETVNIIGEIGLLKSYMEKEFKAAF